MKRFFVFTLIALFTTICFLLRRIASVRKECCISHLVVVVVFVVSSICVKGVSAQKILSQTGFENYTAAHKKSPFQPSENTVKIGKKSLSIFSDKLNDFHLWARGLKTDNPIVSIEFWVYVERGEQSFSVSIHSTEEDFEIEAGGPYIDWRAGVVRCHVLQGNPWRKIGNFPVDRWQYVRIVSDFEKSVFDFYMGNNRKTVLAARPRKNLPFQGVAHVPRARWFVISAAAMTARGYMDDLLIYEGGEPLHLAVEPTAKLTTTWGRIKQQ